MAFLLNSQGQDISGKNE